MERKNQITNRFPLVSTLFFFLLKHLSSPLIFISFYHWYEVISKTLAAFWYFHQSIEVLTCIERSAAFSSQQWWRSLISRVLQATERKKGLLLSKHLFHGRDHICGFWGLLLARGPVTQLQCLPIENSKWLMSPLRFVIILWLKFNNKCDNNSAAKSKDEMSFASRRASCPWRTHDISTNANQSCIHHPKKKKSHYV